MAEHAPELEHPQIRVWHLLGCHAMCATAHSPELAVRWPLACPTHSLHVHVMTSLTARLRDHWHCEMPKTYENIWDTRCTRFTQHHHLYELHVSIMQ